MEITISTGDSRKIFRYLSDFIFSCHQQDGSDSYQSTVYNITPDDREALMAVWKRLLSAEGKADWETLLTYRAIKAQHPDEVLLLRDDDIYKACDDDARLCSETLGLRDAQNPHWAECSFPVRELDANISKLTQAGFRVVTA